MAHSALAPAAAAHPPATNARGLGLIGAVLLVVALVAFPLVVTST